MDDPAATGLDEDASGLLEVSDVGPLEPTSGCVLFEVVPPVVELRWRS